MPDPNYTADPGAARMIEQMRATGNTYTQAAIDKPDLHRNHADMTDLTRQQVTDMLSASEAKVDARLANFDTSVKEGFAGLRTGMAEMRAEMAKQSGDMRAEMANVRADTHKGTIDVIKWVVGFGIAILGTVLALSKTSDKPAPQPIAQPAPIIITIPGAAPVQATPPAAALAPHK